MEVGSNGSLCLSVGAIPALAYVYMDTKAHNVLTPDRHHRWAFSAFAAAIPHLLFHLSIIQYSAISHTMKEEKANLWIVTFFLFFYVFAFTVQIAKQLSVKSYQLALALSDLSFLWNSECTK